MAFSSRLLLSLFVSSIVLHVALGEIICDDLPNDLCTFSISSSGKRCLLETYSMPDGGVEYQCRTSEVMIQRISNYIETDDCVLACGVDRKSVGISSDAFLEPQFAGKLCSPDCYQNCPNIIDLYFNLAAGEGAFLPDLCTAQRSNPHRAMIELMSNGNVAAPGPNPGGLAGEELTAYAPAPAPSSF